MVGSTGKVGQGPTLDQAKAVLEEATGLSAQAYGQGYWVKGKGYKAAVLRRDDGDIVVLFWQGDETPKPHIVLNRNDLLEFLRTRIQEASELLH